MPGSGGMLTNSFPDLSRDGYTEESPGTIQYNCFAWAASDDTQRWDPDPLFQNAHWPDGVPREQTFDAFVQAFEQLGYEECDTEILEPGVEKVAIYERFGVPQHMARQLDNGSWTSKLGDDVDINHALRGLEGAIYGTVTKILRRKRS